MPASIDVQNESRAVLSFAVFDSLRAFTRGVLPPRGTRLRATLKRVAQGTWLLLPVGLLFFVYGYFVSAGAETWPVYGAYFDLLSEGFRNGQLHLPLPPAPELLRASDPYDRVNVRYWALDASFYQGKYYIYWGPVPALVQALGKSILGIRRIVGDQYQTLFSLCLAAAAGALLLARMARRLFPEVPRWLVTVVIFALGFANPNLHSATTGAAYQTAILSAQAWLLVGLVLAFEAVWFAGGGGLRYGRLLLTGTAFGLSLASRLTVAPALAVFVLATAFAEAWSSERRLRRALANSVLLGAPLAATGAALLYYNQLRFDDWFEFGLKYQLSGYPALRFSSEYWLPNLFSYTLRPFEASCHFPYAFQVWLMGESAFPPGFPRPDDYMIDEPVVGFLVAVPLTWLCPLAFLFAPWRRRFSDRASRAYFFCLICFSALATMTGIAALGVYGATMRYLNDVTYGLVLLAALGVFAFRNHRVGRHVPWAVSGGTTLLSLAGIALGLALGYQGYNGHFRLFNPSLDRALRDQLSMCDAVAPPVPRYSRRGPL